MANQDPNSKIDRTGGDATKSDIVATPEVEKTQWAFLTSVGPNGPAAQDND